MSLLDTLLLDPVRINVWIACRTDGIAGSGTQNDPYDGSTLDRFDYVMRELIEDEVKTCVHLGPGEFLTGGYHDDQGENEGWQAKPGMKIVGSGMGVTTDGLSEDHLHPHEANIGISLTMAEDAIVENNLIDLGRPDPIQYRDCTNVHYFNNTTPAGKLITGTRQPPLIAGVPQYSAKDLSVLVEDSLLLSML